MHQICQHLQNVEVGHYMEEEKGLEWKLAFNAQSTIMVILE